MSKKYIVGFVICMAIMLAVTLIGTYIQFACIGKIMPIWHWRYSEIEAYASIVFMWALLPYEYISLADLSRTLQELDELETSE